MFSSLQTLLVAGLLLLATQPQPYTGELLSVFSQASVQMSDDNQLEARNQAMNQAFNTALWNTAKILLSPDELERNQAMIHGLISSRVMEYIQSYKFIRETADTENHLYEIDLQVTVFLDHFRSALDSTGLALETATKSKVVVIINENVISALSGAGSLHLPSNTEKELGKSLEKLGFGVINRTDVVSLKQDNNVQKAVDGNAEAIFWLAKQYDAKYLILGKASVNSYAAEGESKGWVEAEVEGRVYDGLTGEAIWSDSILERTEGDPATGSFRAVRLAAEKFNLKVIAFIYNHTETM